MSTGKASEQEVLQDSQAVAHRAAALILRACDRNSGRIAISLSGGSTPRLLYQLLATPEYCHRLPWQRVHWFWGDERFVPADHPDSNFGMVSKALFEQLPFPVEAANIHPMQTAGMDVESAAAAYELELQRYYGSSRLDESRPLFDITLLGLGDDGHTASLFPKVPALAEQQRWTASVVGAKPEPRLSLTFPAINSSRLVLMLVTGSAKHGVLERLRQGADLPAAQVRPAGRLLWLLDNAAASGG